jgi:hypothetical protein
MFRRGIAMTPGIMGAKSATPEKSCTECFAAQIEGEDGPQMDRDGQVSHTGVARSQRPTSRTGIAHGCGQVPRVAHGCGRVPHGSGHVADTRTGVAKFRA